MDVKNIKETYFFSRVMMIDFKDVVLGEEGKGMCEGFF